MQTNHPKRCMLHATWNFAEQPIWFISIAQVILQSNDAVQVRNVAEHKFVAAYGGRENTLLLYVNIQNLTLVSLEHFHSARIRLA